MSTWAKHLDPALFDGFQDWYDNFVNKCGLEPADYLKEMAQEYYIERDRRNDEDDWIRDNYMLNFQADDLEE